ncbi:MAG: glycosyltransferase family 4 protein [Verrucomicrobiota bacterium]
MRWLLAYEFPKTRGLGASRVWYDFGQALEGLGHDVEHFTADQAFPDGLQGRIRPLLRVPLFAKALKEYLEKHPDQYDVVDCHLGVFPKRPEVLSPNTLIATRSVGLFDIYKEVLATLPSENKFGPLSVVERAVDIWRASARRSQFGASDLVNVPNSEEVERLSRDGCSMPVVHFPYGISEREIKAVPKETIETQPPRLIFLGMWCYRKGKHDIRDAFLKIIEQVPEAQLELLGVSRPENEILAEFPESARGNISVTSRFEPDQLFQKIDGSAVALFPSYAEGFGIAVIEQLLSGIPVFAYNIGGPADILNGLPYAALFERGDKLALANSVINYLKMPEKNRDEIRTACRKHALSFQWESIAADTAEAYQRIRSADPSAV